MHCKYPADTTYRDIYIIPLHELSPFNQYNRVTSQRFSCTLIRQKFFGVSKFRSTMQFQALQIAFSRSCENQSKTFENQIKCVIARTPCFLRN